MSEKYRPGRAKRVALATTVGLAGLVGAGKVVYEMGQNQAESKPAPSNGRVLEYGGLSREQAEKGLREERLAKAIDRGDSLSILNGSIVQTLAKGGPDTSEHIISNLLVFAKEKGGGDYSDPKDYFFYIPTFDPHEGAVVRELTFDNGTEVRFDFSEQVLNQLPTLTGKLIHEPIQSNANFPIFYVLDLVPHQFNKPGEEKGGAITIGQEYFR